MTRILTRTSMDFVSMKERRLQMGKKRLLRKRGVRQKGPWRRERERERERKQGKLEFEDEPSCIMRAMKCAIMGVLSAV